MEETADRPKWLLELENRKRKPRLAHEAGAGAPCMVCSTACPGLDLHFWRKICKNCKCSRDDHDFDDDDFPQFDMLFGPTKKFKRKPILLHVNNEKQHEGEAAFEWVPPDTTMEVATDYMKALPIEKLPIKGSAGAALRKQLLQKQLPLHDIDHKACDELSEQEKKQFEKYLENIKKYVGQGKVTKILGARPFDRSLMTPANATDMQRLSPQHKSSSPNSTVQLRTPSSFTPKSTYAKNLYKMLNKQDQITDSETMKNIPVLEKYNIVNSYNNSEIVKSEPIKSGIYNQNSYPVDAKLDNFHRDSGNKSDSTMEEHPNCSNPLATTNITNSELTPWNHSENFRQGHKDVLRNPATSLAHSCALNEDAQIAESILADAFLPPSTVHANDIIGSTLDEKRLMFIREKLTDKYSNQESQVPHKGPNVSRDLDSNDLLRRNHITRNTNLPGNVDKSNERTAIVNAMKNPSGTTALSENGIKRAENDKVVSQPIIAEKDVIKPVSQIVHSIPLDSTLTNNPLKMDRLKENLSATQGIMPHSPSRITGTLDRVPQVPIFSNTLSSATPEHPSKLSTSTVPSNVIHSEQLHNQIFPHEAVGMSNQVQNLPNVEHLRGAMEELTMDSLNVKSQKCNNCEEEIRIGDVVVVTEKAKNSTWHPGCFVCSMCNELLVDLVYFHYKNKLYCGRDLATLLGIPRCFACDELIFVREYTVAEGHNYHVKHFCCWDCDVPLAGQQYITENDRPLCLPCYQKTYAKTCNGCNKVIAADQQGVAVKNLNFHATEECFCCHTCKKYLLNGRMAVKEERLFCSKECISQFLHPQT